MQYMKKIFLFFLVFSAFFVFTLPCSAQLDIRSFIPRITDYTGKLVIDAAHRADETESDGEGSESKNTKISEKITFSLVGFVYHPRFMSYRLDLSGSLGQSHFKSGAEDTGWKFRTGTEFNFRTIVLPYHPYTLELYAARREPLILGALSGDKTIITERGALFRYRKRPFSLNMDYNLLTTERGPQKTDNIRYSIRGGHSAGFISTSIGYFHSERSGDDSEGKTDGYTLSNTIRFWKLSLSSSVNYSDSVEKDLAKTIYKSLSWREDLRIDLPWNFEGNISFNHLKTSFKRKAEDTPFGELDITNRSNALSFGLSHTLFESLRSSLSMDYTTNKSDDSETETRSGSLLFSYSKKIPIGRLFANFSGRKSITERTGIQFNIRESFLSDIGVGEEIILQQGANPDTVSVEVRGCFFDDDGNERRITAPLIRDDNYFVDVIDNRVIIVIISLFVQRGEDFIDIEQCSDDEGNLLPFEFLVTYGIAGDSKVETLSRAYGLRLDLFGGLISPYYNRVELKQKILEGVVPFKPEESQSDAIGIAFNKPPFRLSAEYFQLKSEFRPSKGYKTSVEYEKFLTPTFRARIRAFFNRTELTKARGATEEVMKEEVREDDYGLNISAHKRFSRYLNLSLGSAVSKRRGESESLSYSFRGDLSWAIGKISVKTGASVSHSDTEFKRGETKRLGQYYYLKIERTLF